MHTKSALAASLLAASSLVACGGLLFQPTTSDDEDTGMHGGDGGHDPTGGPGKDGGIDGRDAGVAHDGGPNGDAAPEASTTPCGNGVLTPDEACDDGNKSGADGCSA